MKALILNSGMGKRMGVLTSEHPKCMTELGGGETIISRQLKLLQLCGIDEVIITTGLFDKVLVDYCNSLNLNLNYTFVINPIYEETNYIYSIYLAREYLQDDIILMHGDLVFELVVLQDVLKQNESCMTISSTIPLPPKDFKAVLKGGLIEKVGVEFFDAAVAAQPLYKINKVDWNIWLERIILHCENRQLTCYAENAFNEVADICHIYPMDFMNHLCAEIDTPEDLVLIKERVNLMSKRNKSVYMSFSTDVIHGGHIAIIKKAAQLGELTIGMLTDEVVASYRRFPILKYEERVKVLEAIKGVNKVISQKTLSYAENLRRLRPDYVIHGDNWITDIQKPIRDEVIEVLKEYGGELIEYPYASNAEYEKLELSLREQLSMPDIRRGRLKQLLEMKTLVSVIEAHSGITGLIAEKTTVIQDGKTYQFDAMWCSSLCDSTVKGKPDIELVDMSTRMRTVHEIMDVTTKPIIIDADTGGLTEHFVYNIRTLERMGVSAAIIEDKTGLKKNSLFGNDVEQAQDTIENFCSKLTAGKAALKTKEFFLIARVESLILDKGMEDALARAFAYVKAGANGIMIHSRKKDPAEIFEFCEKFRAEDAVTPLVVVPTSFNTVSEEEFAKRGVNIVIYANQLTRSGFPAMQNVAKTILTNHRAKEADDMCMSIKEILTLIPENY